MDLRCRRQHPCRRAGEQNEKNSYTNGTCDGRTEHSQGFIPMIVAGTWCFKH
jgi:hypothetical protein